MADSETSTRMPGSSSSEFSERNVASEDAVLGLFRAWQEVDAEYSHWLVESDRIDDALWLSGNVSDATQRKRSEAALAKAKEKEAAAGKRAALLMDTVFATPATSIAGVAAKISLVLEHGAERVDSSVFPWPELRGTLADLQRLSQGACGLRQV